MNKYEIIEFFITGIDLGMLTKDDLYSYILGVIEESDTPDPIYCEIALELSKDWKILRSVLLGILHDEGFVYGFEQRISRAYRYLIEGVGRRYERKEITLKETVYLFYKFAVEFEEYLDENDPEYWFMLFHLDDEYDLAEQGISGTVEDVEKQVMEIIEENRKFIDKNTMGGIEKWLQL